MTNELDFVEVGLFCVDICRALDRGMNGKKLNDLSQSVCEAINQLMMRVALSICSSNPSAYCVLDRRTVAEIQKKITKQSGRHRVSRFFYAGNDKNMIAAWKSDLNGILNVFNVCSVRSCLFFY